MPAHQLLHHQGFSARAGPGSCQIAETVAEEQEGVGSSWSSATPCSGRVT